MEFIISALASAAGSPGLEGVQRGYSRLRELLRSKFGAQSALAEAVEQSERHPDSAARKAVLAEEPAKVGADKDEEVQAAAKRLQELLQGVQPQASVTQQVTGDGNIFSGTGNVEVKR